MDHMHPYFVCSAVLLLSGISNAQKPVLQWSARTAADIDTIAGTAVGSDGAIDFVAMTASGTDFSKPNFRNSQIVTGKLNPDGASACSATLGGSFDDIPYSMGAFPDGTLLVAGRTDSPDFPRLPNRQPTASEEFRSFLMRVSPCDGKIRYSTYLPAGFLPSVVAIAADESVYVGAASSNLADVGALLHFDAQGARILSQITLRGIPLSVALDRSGSVITTGMLGPVQSNGISVRRAFLSNYTQDLQRAVYDLTLGESSAMAGTVLFNAGDSLYVGGFGTRPGETLINLAYSDKTYVPFFQNSSAWLARIWPDGSVASLGFVDLASLASFTAYRRPVGLGAGPDGRLWLAITGPTSFPRTMAQGVELDGVLLASFKKDGTPAGGETLVPGLRPYFPRPVVAFSPSGRIAELSLNPYLPTTPRASPTGALSAVVFDLAGADAAPEIRADREILDIDTVSFPGTPYLTHDPKAVRIQRSDGSAGEFTAATVLDANRGISSSPPPFSITGDGTGQLPVSILISSSQQPSFNSAALVALTTGAQGTVAIPIRSRGLSAGLVVQALDPLQLPAPSSDPFTVRLSISSVLTAGLPLNLPFHITYQASWLRLETSEGTTPAVLNAVIDPTGLATGTHLVTLNVEIAGVVIQRTLALTIGPILQVSPSYGLIDVPFGKVRTVGLTVTSSSAPLDFTVDSPNPALDVSPKQGTTPQALVATFNSAGFPANQTAFEVLNVRANGQQIAYSLQFRVTTFTPPVTDLPPQQGAPGSLITFYTGKSQCDTVAFSPGRWATSLGGCTLRVNGAAIPLGSIETANFQPLPADPRNIILGQLPYDLVGPATLEIEDKTGSKGASPLTVKPVLPMSRDSFQNVAPTRRTGEEMLLRMTGLGVTVTPAPLGDVPDRPIVPVVPIQVFVGGRKAHLISVELSRTEVGTFEVRFEVPEIAPDLHDLSLSIDGSLISVGNLIVAPDLPPTGGGCTYGLSIGGQAFGMTGGDGRVDVTTQPGCAWSASGAPDWVMLTSRSGSANGTVSYSVGANGGAARKSLISIGGLLFVIEQAAASAPGALVGTLPQVTSEGPWEFLLDLVNLGGSQANARVNFIGDNGAPLLMPLTFPQSGSTAGPLLAFTLDRAISSNAQVLISSAGPTAARPLVGWGQLLASGGAMGFGIFSAPGPGWNAIVPLETRRAAKYYLLFDNTTAGGNQLATGVAVANLSFSSVSIPVIIRNDTGAQIGTAEIDLGAQGHTSFMLDAQYASTAGKRGTIEFDTPPGGQIGVLGLRANGGALTTLPVLASTDAAGGAIAHATYNGGFTSTFYFVNTGLSSAQLALSFYDDAGNPLTVPLRLPQTSTNAKSAVLTQTLTAGAMLAVETVSDDGAASIVGSARLTTDGSVSGFEVFRWTTFGQEASVPLETRTPASFVLVFDDTHGLTTGVALSNAATSGVNVAVKIYDDAGNLLQTTSANVAGKGHTSFLLPSNYPLTANKRGMVEFVVPAGGQIALIGLRAKGDAGTLTTIPVLVR
jgi:hypothetical protein